eukprot:CAMPEP_0119139692 /NCGR_PEP_ID=MMETSP1310-20130426/27954_1 /TAXON_ID=464262 /ORGANISM="Genus nov. species nov., Strain RCC2339" /LENGTH=257 /DNA_ID=CAMNT_0007131003 /DNA_START=24 /DNA_END=794 /DNA_ORIENTATION=+
MNPSRALSEAVRRAKGEKQRAALVCFVTCGFPTVADTVPVLLALQEAGADVLELGIPFSDPIAEGPTIQYSSQVALEQNVTFKDCIETVARARKAGVHVPIVLMGYLNPLVRLGEERAVREAAEAGANGFIVVDLPPEHDEVFQAACSKYRMASIPLIAPTSRVKRMQLLLQHGSGFAYAIAVTGVTGARSELASDISDYLSTVRDCTALPLCVGFGVSTRDHFLALEPHVDGIVIGSAIIKAIDKSHKEGRPAADG